MKIFSFLIKNKKALHLYLFMKFVLSSKTNKDKSTEKYPPLQF